LKKDSKEIWFILAGEAEIIAETGNQTISKGVVMDCEFDQICIIPRPSIEILQVSGIWNNEKGSCGVFTLARNEKPRNDGDPVSYSRNTVFDNHFHDCDEYWFIVKGKGTVVSGGIRYDVQSGDCVLTRAGENHDFPIVREEILAVWFEGSLMEKKREGHLYREK